MSEATEVRLRNVDFWLSWIDDLPLPTEFEGGVNRLQEFVSGLRTALAAERIARLAAESDPLQKWRALTARAEAAEATLAARDVEIARLREWHEEQHRQFGALPHGHMACVVARMALTTDRHPVPDWFHDIPPKEDTP